MVKLTVEQRIIKFLKKNLTKWYSNTQISNYLKININTTRKELGNLINFKKVDVLKFNKETLYSAA